MLFVERDMTATPYPFVYYERPVFGLSPPQDQPIAVLVEPLSETLKDKLI